jgi:hypothetical protein
MGTILEDTLAAAQRAAALVDGGPIVYERGDRRVSIDRAAFGRTEFTVAAGEEIRTETTDRDFIFAADALILDGRRATPQPRDLVVIVHDDRREKETFEVLPLPGQKCFHFCDPRGILLRVHTKRVSA